MDGSGWCVETVGYCKNVTAFVGDTNWTDYTITLKARKLSGENGFQIYFHCKNIHQRIRWDIGGYGNSVNMMDIGRPFCEYAEQY